MVPTWPKSCRKEQRPSEEATSSDTPAREARTLAAPLGARKHNKNKRKASIIGASGLEKQPLRKISLYKKPSGDFTCDSPASFGGCRVVIKKDDSSAWTPLATMTLQGPDAFFPCFCPFWFLNPPPLRRTHGSLCPLYGVSGTLLLPL